MRGLHMHLLLVWLQWLTINTTAAAWPFRVYGPCNPRNSSLGFCRKDPVSQLRGGGPQIAAVPAQLPVDMRFPCTDEHRCKLNIDVVRRPEPPVGPHIGSCSIPLMPWSPFPCKYDTKQYYGIPGQLVEFCYTDHNHAHPDLGSARLASNLSADGYDNVFEGVLPQQLCGLQQPEVVQLILTIDFRLAAGRQFDRAYFFQIGQAVVAFGTCSEPSRLIDADKKWSVVLDITHTQSYLQAGKPTRFTIGNILSNTYNVPLWAAVTLEVHYKAPQKLASADSNGDAKQVRRRSLMMPPTHATLSVWSSPDVPDEVVPLVSPGAPQMGALAALSGNGDRPLHWPNVTYTLPDSFVSAGNLYKAQLQVQPKGDACEEFWAMNPSGLLTNTLCDGLSTGEPYREIRLYVDGELAGLYPVMYTMYTGGIDPRLWTAIVAVNTYSLPIYTFDLSPWLGVLNGGQTQHNITVEVTGATGSRWLLATTLLAWRSEGHVVTAPRPVLVMSESLMHPVQSTCEGADLTNSGTCTVMLKQRSMTALALVMENDIAHLAFVRYSLHDYYNNITYNNSAGTISWKQVTKHDIVWFNDKLDDHGLGAPRHGFAGISDEFVAHVSRYLDANITAKVYTKLEWLNNGGIADGAIFEFSDNATVIAPHVAGFPQNQGFVVSRSRGHYQRLEMVDVYDTNKPSCIVPKQATHLVVLHDTLPNHAPNQKSLTWHASCAFCSPELLENDATMDM